MYMYMYMYMHMCEDAAMHAHFPAHECYCNLYRVGIVVGTL